MVGPENQPMITDWMSAWGTVGTLAASLILSFISLVMTLNDRRGKRHAEKMERAKAFAHVEVDDQEVRWSVVNASPYPIRQVHLLAVPFMVGPAGKKLAGSTTRNLSFSTQYIEPSTTHKEAPPRTSRAEWNVLLPWIDYAIRLDFVDYQGTHWVRAANGDVTPIEKLKGGGFAKLPRTRYEPDLPRRWRWPRRQR
ncbi:hypothetical protein [Arthrobacter sp. ISL-65]|uniref:hypothetical protein n=1 Tax=Arthrobacter sp. ISL-65 TaxID=2819112 RepID=UPI001BED262B|nr:hypothetical protein [Arthrobacter sp. ISL-65]MBT2549800.1 hypothetical protein [Arthrobacter sp. ISL-65]